MPATATPMQRVALAALAATALFAAQARADCPPLGTLPGFTADETRSYTRTHAAHDFRMPDPADPANQLDRSVAGRYCQATWNHDGNGPPPSDLEIHYNFREQLAALGAELLVEEDRNTHARLAKDGRETWFHIYSQEDLIEQWVVTAAPHATRLGAAADGLPFGAMPGYQLKHEPERRNFDREAFVVQQGESDEEVQAEGAITRLAYAPGEGTEWASDLDIQLAYRAAIEALGGEVLRAGSNDTTGRLLHEERPAWVRVYSQEDLVEVTWLQEKPFQSSLQPPRASELAEALASTGRVALYVNFDFGRASLRPDAEPVIAEVAALLAGDPALALDVVGHTDAVGDDADNLRLSAARAEAVRAALLARGVDPARLAARGAGEAEPLADNGSSQGRARNRRVELVRR